jgi:predicted DsbA family dithiol-disulfide isomerase
MSADARIPMQTAAPPIRIDYFSDLLCIWAYVSQIRLDELKQSYAASIDVDQHFIPVFGSTQRNVVEGWKDKGGPSGYGTHVLEVARRFPHVEVHPEIWTRGIPPTSASAHLFLKSVQLLQRSGQLDAEPQSQRQSRSVFDGVAWALRVAFFRDMENIAERTVQLAIAERHAIPMAALERQLDDGHAMAHLCADMHLQEQYKVRGSPTYVLNEGRQVLYGNLGYKVIAANVDELLRQPGEQASWC